jgi:hypothetical protein
MFRREMNEKSKTYSVDLFDGFQKRKAAINRKIPFRMTILQPN